MFSAKCIHVTSKVHPYGRWLRQGGLSEFIVVIPWVISWKQTMDPADITLPSISLIRTVSPQQ